jgi:hypothetical protein
MKAHQLFNLIQSTKLGRNNRLMQSRHTEEIVTKSRRLALVQLRKPFPQTPLNWAFLLKQCDRLCQFFVHFAETSQEPKVSWKRDRQGRSYFQIYDPFTEKYHCFDSEQNALIWLEQGRFTSASRSHHQQFTKNCEKIPNKKVKSFDYFGRH